MDEKSGYCRHTEEEKKTLQGMRRFLYHRQRSS